MTLPGGFEYGFRAHEQDVWCIRRADADRTLCLLQVSTSRGVGYFPAAQPVHPQAVCQRCHDAMWGPRPDRKDRPVVYGMCPVCGGQQPMFEGRMQGHGRCAGVNMPSVVKR